MPTPTLVWVFNNGDLPSGINQFNHKGESFLEFLSVTKGMEGTYKCEAKNKANTTVPLQHCMYTVSLMIMTIMMTITITMTLTLTMTPTLN